MDSKEIKNIDAQIQTLLDHIWKQQEAIQEYQTGQVAFADASSALVELAKSHGALVEQLKANLEKLETAIKLEEQVANLTSTLKSLDQKLDSLNAKLDDGFAALAPKEKEKKRRFFRR